MGDAAQLEGNKRHKLELVCGIMTLLLTLASWLLNAGIFPTTSLVFPLGREIQTLFSLLVTVAIAICALYKPTLLRMRALSICMCVSALVGCVLLALFPYSAAITTFGLVLRSIATRWCTILFALACAWVGATNRLAVSLTLGTLGAILIETFMPVPAYSMCLVALFGILVIVIGLLQGTAEAYTSRVIAAGPAREAIIANPSSFVSPVNQVFVLILIFLTARGFSLALRSVDYTPLSSPIQLVALGVVTIWFACAEMHSGATHRNLDSLDALFVLSALFIVAGYLVAPVDVLAREGIANGLLLAGNGCFGILLSLSMAALCARNPSGAFLVIAYACIASSLGMFVGADSGHLLNLAFAGSSEATSVVVGIVVLILFAYVLVGLRGFSFAQTIRGIEPPVPVVAPDVAGPTRDGLFCGACSKLAASAGLTSRESEVLEILARGRNASHIQEELTISYNTAKTHVKRVYAKLGVHSQQELIDLVEQEMR